MNRWLGFLIFFVPRRDMEKTPALIVRDEPVAKKWTAGSGDSNKRFSFSDAGLEGCGRKKNARRKKRAFLTKGTRRTGYAKKIYRKRLLKPRSAFGRTA
ncbi:MAG: hypothetical protein CW346_02260 [Bacillaceae bacterium]|nr:hypothetical protein [Bacillaceae bacterium]